jgi:hypothetical protein
MQSKCSQKGSSPREGIKTLTGHDEENNLFLLTLALQNPENKLDSFPVPVSCTKTPTVIGPR